MAIDPAGVVVIGAGQAGFQLAVSLREAGFEGAIRLIGEEADLPYQRPPLSKAFLGGTMDAADLSLTTERDLNDLRIDWLAGRAAVEIDRAARRVRLVDGRRVSYGHLVLATGARNRRLVGAGCSGDVISLRDRSDAERLRDRARSARSLAVIGAGFLGLEVAATLKAKGMDVHVFEAVPFPMARATTPDVARIIADQHTQEGIGIHLGCGPARVCPAVAEGIRTETMDGQSRATDMVLVSIGVQANSELAEAAGLPCKDGILVDECLATPDEHVSAIGDCAAFLSRRLGGRIRLESVQNAVDQAVYLAGRLVGRAGVYDRLPWFWSEQGKVRLQIAGLPTTADQAIVRGVTADLRFSVYSFLRGRLVAVESVNSPADHVSACRLLQASCPLTAEQAADPSFDVRRFSKEYSAIASS